MKKIMLVILIGFAFGQTTIDITADKPTEGFDWGVLNLSTTIPVDDIITVKENSIEYERGFKNALESLALLALELDLKNERKTYGEMFNILYERYQINNK